MKRSELQGKRFGRLFVIKYSSTKNGKAKWLCRCDCGEYSVVQTSNLLSRHTQSCGCIRKYSPGYDSHGKKTRLYQIWSQMKGRCYNPKNNKYPWYGGKGVSVCDAWHDFIVFHEWAVKNGYQDSFSIDRIDPAGDYCPENCRWTNSLVQGINKNRSRGAGVSWEKRRNCWRARLTIKGKEVFCRQFNNYDDAVEAIEKERHRRYAEIFKES